jgi:hypothetical protein
MIVKSPCQRGGFAQSIRRVTTTGRKDATDGSI